MDHRQRCLLLLLLAGCIATMLLYFHVVCYLMLTNWYIMRGRRIRLLGKRKREQDDNQALVMHLWNGQVTAILCSTFPETSSWKKQRSGEC